MGASTEDITRIGRADDVAVMTWRLMTWRLMTWRLMMFTEFGRRVEENMDLDDGDLQVTTRAT